MDKLPDFQEIEDAYQGVSDVLGRLPEDSWSNRARDHNELSKEAAYQNRDRVKPDRTETAPPVEVPAGLGFASRGPVTIGWGWPRVGHTTVCITQEEEAR